MLSASTAPMNARGIGRASVLARRGEVGGAGLDRSLALPASSATRPSFKAAPWSRGAAITPEDF